MEERMPKDVPYIVFEGEMARNERLVKRLVMIIVMLIVLLAVTNGAWLYMWNQYDTYSYDQDGEGLNSINTGIQGDLLNEPKIKDKGSEEQEKDEGSLSSYKE